MKVTHVVDGIDFEWDSQKAVGNAAKHRVTFEEAVEVFFDPFVVPVESRVVEDETRDGVVGLTRRWRLLYVAYTWRRVIRIISARKATQTERNDYERR